MPDKVKINAVEFQLIVITFTIGSTVLLIPGSLAAVAKQDAWISSALTILISFLFIFLYFQLAKVYPTMTYVMFNEKILGKWLGKISAAVFLFYFFEIATASTREIGDFLSTQILIGTPIEMIMMMFLVTSLIGVRLGLEAICRTAIIFFPWIAVLLFILCLFLIPEAKIENIQPILGEGVKPVLMGVYYNIGYPLELIVFLMITPNMTEKPKLKKVYYSGAFVGGFIVFLLVTLCILVLGADSSARLAYPSYTLGKKISIGGFFERIEVVVAIIWFFTIYFKLTICYYALSFGLSQLLGLKSNQILLFPLFFLILPFSIFGYPDIVHFHEYANKGWIPFTFTIGLLQPLFLLVIGKWRGKYTTKT